MTYLICHIEDDYSPLGTPEIRITPTNLATKSQHKNGVFRSNTELKPIKTDHGI